jgi:hypothetical protein
MINNSCRKETGFVGVVFLAIALIGVVVGAIAAMNRGSSSGTADSAMRASAAQIIKIAADYKLAFDRMTVDGASTSNFSSTPGGWFDPAAKYAIEQMPPANAALKEPMDGVYFVYHLGKLPAIGTASGKERFVTLKVTLPACQAINSVLYNDGKNATPALSNSFSVDWFGTNGDDVHDENNLAANYVGRPEGCIKTGDGLYHYYKVMSEA